MSVKGMPNREAAEALALRALAHLVGSEHLRRRFFAVSGHAPEDLAERAADPEFLAGVLDFLLANEPDLLAFCTDHDLDPELPARAREHLPGGRFAAGGGS